MSEIASPTTAAPTEEELGKALQIQVVDVSQGVAGNAIDSAEEFIREQTTQTGAVGLVKRIWYGNIARDYIRQREIQKGRNETIETRNLYVRAGGSQADHDAAMVSVVERFTSEYIHDGETNQDLNEVENGAELQNRLNVLIHDFASGTLDRQSLVEEKTRLLNEFGAHSRAEDRNKGLLFADNVVDVAVNARLAVVHGVALDRIDAFLTAKVGEAQMGVRTEARLQAADKVLDKLYKTKIGSMVNETSIATVAAIGISVSRFIVTKAVTAAGATIGMGVGAGVFAGAREHLRVGQERQAHGRQMAEGGEMPQGQAKKREKLEATRYETVQATELSSALQAARDSLRASNPAEWQTAIATIREAHVRIMLSDEKAIDLVAFSGKTAVEDERLTLDIRLAEAKTALKLALEGASDEDLQNAAVTSRDTDQVVGDHAATTAELLQDMSDKDRVFNKLRRNRTLTMAACGFASSVVVGTALQEVKSALSSDLQGVFEKDTNSQNRRTLLAGIFRENGNSSSDLLQPTDVVNINDHAQVKLPEGFHFAEDGENQWQLIDANNKVITNDLAFGDNGRLTEASQQLLADHGVVISEDVNSFSTQKVITEQVERAPKDYIAEHADQFTEVKRQLWYDNNTEKVFDKNELKLHWGGNSGVDANGNYVFNIQQMMPDGSFHNIESGNAQQLMQDGKMSIAMSMTQDTQKSVFMVAIDTNGNAVIDKNSFIGQSLFENRGGKAHFMGAYAEAVQVMGQEPDGRATTRMLATVVGENNAKPILDTVEHIVVTDYEKIITSLEVPVAENLPIEVPFVMPFYGRRGLEKLPTRERVTYGYGAYSPEQLRHLEEERSPRLRRDALAVLDPEEELSWYRAEIERRRGEEYLREIDEQIINSPELSSIDNQTKALVCIPVAATSEAANIYNTLSLYAQQEGAGRQQTALLLHVNWVDDAQIDPAKQEQIDKTLAEIERARQDFPDLPIATIKTVWERSFITKRKGVIGEVARRLYDTALMSVEKSMRDGRRSPDADMLIIRNDADAQGISREYLTNMIKAAENEKDADGFVGSVRWDTAEHREYPGFGVVTNFREIMHAITGRKSSTRRVPTIGINTAVRASMFAAVGCIGTGSYIGAGSDDLEIGHRIYEAREPGGSKPEPVVNTYGEATSGRRGRRTAMLEALAERRRPLTYSAPVAGSVTARPIRVVRAATIDSAGERLLNLYRQDKPVTDAWSDFDQGGHKERGEVNGVLSGPEKLTDMGKIAGQIETNISAMGTQWFNDPTYMRTGIAFMFPESSEDGQPIYSLTWQGSQCVFRLTDPGKKWLRQRLERDGLGRFDHYGSRVRRNLYQDVKPGARKQPKTSAPRFVQAVVQLSLDKSNTGVGMEETQQKLEALRSSILSDLKPLIESAGFTNEQKFNLLLASAKATGSAQDLEAAQTTALTIDDPSTKADALLELLEEIDIQLGAINFEPQQAESTTHTIDQSQFKFEPSLLSRLFINQNCYVKY